MRLSPFLSTLFYTFSNITRVKPPLPSHLAFRPISLRSMSGIPLLGALFGTSSKNSSNMSYPDQRSNDEWRAVLNKGMFLALLASLLRSN